MRAESLTIDDCRACGACCVNPSANVAEGFTSYVEIDRGDGILKKRDLVKKLVVLDDAGVPHLRLASDGRCLALAGALMKNVRCTIYHHRPSACRRVEPGSVLCLRYREDLALRLR